MFHARDLDMKDLPDQKLRNPEQYYIMFLEESPQMDSYPAMEFFSYDSPPYKKLNTFFNWTMTYRRDSDFYTPYGRIIPKNWGKRNHPSIKPLKWAEYSNGLTGLI